MIWLAAAAQEPLRYQVRHDHWRKYCTGELEVTGASISYRQTSGKKQEHNWTWDYRNVQQLLVSPKTIRVLSYSDNGWKLGADREYEFRLVDGDTSHAYAMLKDALDERFVAAFPDEAVQPLWELPAKLLGLIHGAEGVLKVGVDRIIFDTGKREQSRTWRMADLENISTSGPFQLTLTTYERDKKHYGNLKGFNFQLKQRLTEDRYNQLWRRLNRTKGLPVLTMPVE